MRLLAASTLLLALVAVELPAQPTWSSTPATATGDPGVAAGETVVLDFDGLACDANGITCAGSYTVGSGLVSGFRAPPFGVTTNYFATPGVNDGSTGTATIDFSGFLASRGLLRSVSFYWGSIDSYNTLEVLGAGGTPVLTLVGNDLYNPANGNQTAANTNRRLYLEFGPGTSFTGLRLTSEGRAFEIDDVAMSFVDRNVVPEPSSVALLLAGLGGIGASALRRRRIRA